MTQIPAAANPLLGVAANCHHGLPAVTYSDCPAETGLNTSVTKPAAFAFCPTPCSPAGSASHSRSRSAAGPWALIARQILLD